MSYKLRTPRLSHYQCSLKFRMAIAKPVGQCSVSHFPINAENTNQFKNRDRSTFWPLLAVAVGWCNRPFHSFGDNTCKEGSVLGLGSSLNLRNNRMSTKAFEVRSGHSWNTAYEVSGRPKDWYIYRIVQAELCPTTVQLSAAVTGSTV